MLSSKCNGFSPLRWWGGRSSHKEALENRGRGRGNGFHEWIRRWAKFGSRWRKGNNSIYSCYICWRFSLSSFFLTGDFSYFYFFYFLLPFDQLEFHCPRVGHFLLAGNLLRKYPKSRGRRILRFFFFFLFFSGHLMGVILISYTNERECRGRAITPTKINNIEAHSHTRK